VNSPLSVCREAPDSPACAEVFKSLRNPYYIGGIHSRVEVAKSQLNR
jgi:hypothetical protein